MGHGPMSPRARWVLIVRDAPEEMGNSSVEFQSGQDHYRVMFDAMVQVTCNMVLLKVKQRVDHRTAIGVR